MRIFAGTIATETNTFSPIPTGIGSYMESVFLRPGEHPAEAPLMCTSPLWLARRRAAKDGFTLIEGSCFCATPAGTTNRKDYEFMRDEILLQISEALPLDGVLLGLHGAMVADGYDDVEGDILERVRTVTGPSTTIGVEMDPHCHLTLKRVQNADIIVLYKEFPHLDVVDRANDLIDITLKTISGEISPVMSMFDCRQIGTYPTTLPKMRSFVERIRQMEGSNQVLSVSIGHGFPYADVPELGARILVVTNNDKRGGDALATEIGTEFVSMRNSDLLNDYELNEGISLALHQEHGPVVIVDPADNAGGGAPSDNTTILRALIDRNAESVAIGPVWDPVAVRLCFAAGLGRKMPLRIGGKVGPCSGKPVDANVEILALVEDSWQNFGPAKVPLGASAAVRIGGIDVVLVETRNQAFGLELFTNLGIEPRSKKLVVVKSHFHFMAAYAPIAKKIIRVVADGALNPDFRRIPYAKVNRPIWPLDEHTSPSLIY